MVLPAAQGCTCEESWFSWTRLSRPSLPDTDKKLSLLDALEVPKQLNQCARHVSACRAEDSPEHQSMLIVLMNSLQFGPGGWDNFLKHSALEIILWMECLISAEVQGSLSVVVGS